MRLHIHIYDWCDKPLTLQTLFMRQVKVLPGPLDISSATMFLSNTSVVGKPEHVQVIVYDAFGNPASQSDIMQLKLWVLDALQNISYEIQPDSLLNGTLR